MMMVGHENEVALGVIHPSRLDYWLALNQVVLLGSATIHSLSVGWP